MGGEDKTGDKGTREEAVRKEGTRTTEPRNPEKKKETQGDPERGAAGLLRRGKFLRRPSPPLPSGAPPRPARPEAQRVPGRGCRIAAQWIPSGPPPRAPIGRCRPGLSLLTSSLGSSGRPGAG